MSANVPGQLSSDGGYYWDGAQWVTTLSKDGAHRWNGSAWVPAAPTAVPPAPAPPPASAHIDAPPPSARPASGLAFQFGGAAGWSIGFGVASILLPIISSLTTGGTYYFIVLPLFGIYRGLIAIRVGRVGGGVAGIALNVLGGLLSLLASGLIFH